MKRIVLIFFSTVAILNAAAPTGQTLARAVRFEQEIGHALPLDDVLYDHEGKPSSLRAVFGRQRPAVLVFGYFQCPQLCSVVVSGVTDALRQIEPSIGREFDFVYLSIDPLDTWQDAAKLRAEESGRYGRGPMYSGWHYFVGPKASITSITQSAGFHFTEDLKNRQYAHPSGFVVLTPTGVMSQYFLGVDFSAKDAAEAIHRAAASKTGASVYDLLLICFRGDGISGRYGKLIWRSLQIAVSLTVLGLACGIGWMLRQERRGAWRAPSPGEEEALL